MNTATNVQEREMHHEPASQSMLSRLWPEVAQARRWTLVWPREHGAWGILLVAFLTGAAVGLSAAANLAPLLWLTLAVISVFCLRTPIENSMPKSPYRPRTAAEWRWVKMAASLYVLVAGFAGAMLWFGGALRLVWVPAVGAAGLFGMQAALKRLGRAWRMPAEILAAFGLTLAAMAGYNISAGQAGVLGIGVWLVNGLFATNQILYVQFRIRETRETGKPSIRKMKRIFLVGEGVAVLAIIVGTWAGLLPALTLIAFVPLLWRGAAWSLRRAQTPLRIHRLGKAELAQAILFGILFIAAVRIPWDRLVR